MKAHLAVALAVAWLACAPLPLIAAYSLGTGLTKTDLGVSALGADQQYTAALYRLSNGDPHVVYGFMRSAGQYYTQIWDIGLSNGVSRVLSATPGAPPLSAHIPTSANSVVIGTQDPGHLWEYFPLTGATNYIKACSGRDYYSASLGTDGDVVLGTYGTGTQSTQMESYNPSTQTATEWGKLDSDQTAASYIYSVGGDAGAVYGAIRAGEWYLGAVQKSDGAKVVWWKGGNSSSVEIFKGSADSNWYVRQLTNATVRWWQLSGTNYPTLLGAPPSVETLNDHSGFNNDPDTWAANEGWEVEPEFSVVQVAGSIPQASIRWRKTGATPWNTLIETNGWQTSPYVFLKLVPAGNQLIWTTDNYGPAGFMSSSGTLALSGTSAGLSWYDLLVVDPATDVYFAGYHNRTKRWNPSSAWTYTISSSDTDPSVNPHIVTLNTLGKYHYYLAKANDGRIYIGSHHERGSTGGELGWFDPSDDSNGEERTTFLSYDVRDLKSAVGGTKMVYVSSASDGKVFIWDVATDSVTTSFSPLGSVVLDKVVEYESGKLFGITGTTTFAFTTAGALLWQNTLPSTAWTGMQAYDHRITLGPDGYVWQCAGGNLYRVSTTDGSYQNILSTTTDFNTVFLGTDLYLYGGTGGTKVWKVADALVQTTSATATTLRATTLLGTQ